MQNNSQFRKLEEEGKAEQAKTESFARVESVWTFIQLTKWTKGLVHLPGGTWLELFIRYTQAGSYVQAEELPGEKFVPRVQAKVALDNFKIDFKRVIATRAPEENKDFFLPSKVPRRRLGCLGISNHVAAIVGTPCWPQRVAEKVAQVIVSLITPLTPPVVHPTLANKGVALF